MFQYPRINPGSTAADNVKEDLLLHSGSSYLKATRNYIKSTERFSGSLFD